MIVLSHRGFWKDPSEKNREIAFRRSFENGFGTETDVRDYMGELVISHDIADASCLQFSDFLKIYKSYKQDLPLALNIKADGLQAKLKKYIDEFEIRNYFVFDMSVPDGLVYLKTEITAFTRQSEYEKEPSFYNKAEGIWLDEFDVHWINREIINYHIKNKKKICIVSPDLHSREYLAEWQDYKDIEKELNYKEIILCTDHPEEARCFFSE